MKKSKTTETGDSDTTQEQAAAPADAGSDQVQDAGAPAEAAKSHDPQPDAAGQADKPAEEKLEEEDLQEKAIEAERTQRIAEQRRNFEQLRADTPAQVVKIRAGDKQQLLGLLVVDDRTREVLRSVRMVDWRTEQLTLQAGQSAHIVVLVSDELEHFEAMEHMLAGRLDPPALRESVRQDRLEG